MPAETTWRDIARRVIERVEGECEGMGLAEFRKALREAYPFGSRNWWPYKVWCSEQKIALKRWKYKLDGILESDGQQLTLEGMNDGW